MIHTPLRTPQRSDRGIWPRRQVGCVARRGLDRQLSDGDERYSPNAFGHRLFRQPAQAAKVEHSKLNEYNRMALEPESSCIR